MANDVQIELQGVAELVATLEQLGANVQDAVEQIALAAAGPVAKAVEAKAPGSVGDAIVTATTEKSKKRVTVSVGPDKKKWFARFLEYGTSPHEVTGRKAKALQLYGIDAGLFRASAKHPGMAAQPFMRPAFDETQGEAQSAAGEKVAEVIGA